MEEEEEEEEEEGRRGEQGDGRKEGNFRAESDRPAPFVPICRGDPRLSDPLMTIESTRSRGRGWKARALTSKSIASWKSSNLIRKIGGLLRSMQEVVA